MAANASDLSSQIQQAIDNKTKPLGALGRIEDLAHQIALIQGTVSPHVEHCLLTIFAGDHGLAESGVSAYPQSVTRQMVQNFLHGGAAANVFAKTVDAQIKIVSAGVLGPPIQHSDLLDYTIRPATRNALYEPAMTADEFHKALETGNDLGRSGSHQIACFGEMGIGNTSAASLLISKILDVPITHVIGRGTGLDDDGLARKRAILQEAAARTPDQLDAKTASIEYAGYEIIMMAGAMIGAANTRKIVVVDGFIASGAALIAARMAPGCEAAFIYAHRSAETGHRVVLEALGASPLLDLGMRLGEGSGALLAVPLIRAAAAMLSHMASFEDAAVDGRL